MSDKTRLADRAESVEAAEGVEPAPWFGAPFLHHLSRWDLTGSGLAGLALALAALTVGPDRGTFAAVGAAVLLAALPLLTVVDLRALMLPSRVLYPVFALSGSALTLDAFVGGGTPRALVHAALTGAVLFALAFVVLIVAPAGAFGAGDWRFIGIAGFVLGYFSPMVAFAALFEVAPLVGLLVSVAACVKARSSSVAIPFGPFLAAGCALGLLAPHVFGPLVLV